MEYLQVHLCGLPRQFSGLSGLWVERALALHCEQGETVTPDSGNEGHLPVSIAPFCFYIWGASSQLHGYQEDLDSQGCLRSQRTCNVFDLSVLRCCLWGHCGSRFKTTCETDKGSIRRGCCSTCTLSSSSSSGQVRADCADSPGLQQMWNRRISYSIDKKRPI